MRFQSPDPRSRLSGVVSVIAIDGPVAAGKTVVGRALAQRLDFRYLDTGVMYRAIAWLALRDGLPIEDEMALGKLAETHPVRLKGQQSDQVLVGEHQVGEELRGSLVSQTVSLVARIPAVRRALVQQQRVLAEEGDIVVVGRDIGTVVLPDAGLKVFLSASPEHRARRRWRETQGQSQAPEFQQVLAETKARDEIDSSRADSPLMPALDAFLLDTDELSVDQVVERILSRIRELTAAGER
ncbi:MAG: cytidylate kinase [Acidobacteria bacterium]|nr:cytidylate kinase [Acidobacteriota bacterium]